MGQAFMVAEPRQASLRALNYYPELERLRTRRSIRLGHLPCKVTDSFGDIFTAHLCARNAGVQVLSQVDTFAAEPSGKWINPRSIRRPASHRLKQWQIAISGAGQMAEGNLFGRSILVDNRFSDMLVASDSLVLEFENPGSDLNLWTYAYLNTAMGLRALRSCAYGTSIPRLRVDLVQDIPIPDGKDEVVRRVASLIRICAKQREEYIRQLESATEVLEGSDSRLSNVDGLYGRGAWFVEMQTPGRTVAARNYRPAVQAFPEGTQVVNLLRTAPRKANRFSRTLCSPENGEAFLGQRDLFLIRPIPQSIRTPSASDGLRAESKSIIIAAAGQCGESTLFGRCELGDHFAGKLVSEHTLHLLVDQEKIDHHYLFAVLHCPWGVGALKACATGTSVPSLDPTLLGTVRIPRFEPRLEAAVANRIRKAYSARAEAERAESAAIGIIEQEVLPEWLA